MPGGHKQDNETFKQCALRELEEEVGLKESDLFTYSQNNVYDKPSRSQGVSKPTVVLHATVLENNIEIKADDDAQDVKWYSLDFIKNNRSKFFDDHWEIINNLLYNHHH